MLKSSQTFCIFSRARQLRYYTTETKFKYSFKVDEKLPEPPNLGHKTYIRYENPDQKTIDAFDEEQIEGLSENPRTIAVGFFSFPDFKGKTQSVYSIIPAKSKVGELPWMKNKSKALNTYYCCHPVNMVFKPADSSSQIHRLFKCVENHVLKAKTSELNRLFFRSLPYERSISPMISISQKSSPHEGNRGRQFKTSFLEPCRAVLGSVFKKFFEDTVEEGLKWEIPNETGDIVGHKRRVLDEVLTFENGLQVPIEFKLKLPKAEEILSNIHLIPEIEGVQQLWQQMILIGSMQGKLSSYFTTMIFELQSFRLVGDEREAVISFEVIDHEQSFKTAKAVIFSYITKWAQLSKQDVINNKKIMNDVYLKSRKSLLEVRQTSSELADELVDCLNLKGSKTFHDLRLLSGKDYSEVDTGFGNRKQILRFSKQNYIKSFGDSDVDIPDGCFVKLFVYDPIQGPGPEDFNESLELMEEQTRKHLVALEEAYSKHSHSPLLAGQGFLRITDENGLFQCFGRYVALISYDELHISKNISVEEAARMFQLERERLADLGLSAVDEKGYRSSTTLSKDGKKLMFLEPMYNDQVTSNSDEI